MSNIPIVMYHSINDQPDKNPLGFLSYSTHEFRKHLQYFHNNGFKCITLSMLLNLAREGRLDENKFAVLTFDDGMLDNFGVAVDILNEYDAKATIFVNPEFADDAYVRTCFETQNCWGHLNYAEMEFLEQRGIDIQSHTMTHNMEFSSDRIIDFYTPEKFVKYYWLVWNLFPEQKSKWCNSIEKLRNLIPLGYPIFEYNRAIVAKRFIPTDDFVSRAIECYSKSGESCLSDLNTSSKRGDFENEEEWNCRVKYELQRSKEILESKLKKQIESICFPGGAYNDRILKMAFQCGYKCFMVSSRDPYGDNYRTLTGINQSNNIVGLKRISFTKDYPAFLRNSWVEYLNCKFKVEMFMGSPFKKVIMKTASLVRNFIR